MTAGIPRPVFALLTDFGLHDPYAAEMKAVLLRGVPEAQIVDTTHLVPPQDIQAGSIILERALAAFGPGTIHVAVVDPGVGSTRRILVVGMLDQTVICPDNGLITWAWRRHGAGTARELTWRPPGGSPTFHGRDVMAPTAVLMARGDLPGTHTRMIGDPILLEIAPAVSCRDGVIIHLDQFGNATTNLAAELVAPLGFPVIYVAGHEIRGLSRTYSDCRSGAAVGLIGSSGLLEIAVRDGSAARSMGLAVGDRLTLGDGDSAKAQ